MDVNRYEKCQCKHYRYQHRLGAEMCVYGLDNPACKCQEFKRDNLRYLEDKANGRDL